MKAGLTLSFAVLASFFSTQSALATDGSITFTGAIVKSGCSVSAANKTITVPLGKWGTNTLSTAGATTPPQSFQLQLTNCDPGTYALNLEGTAVAATGDNANLIALDAESTATNVGIQVTSMDDTVIPLNNNIADSASQFTVAEGSTDATLNLKAFYKATGVATAGPANASVNFSIEYK